MRPEQIQEEVSRLGLSEKLLLVEDIWDSIAETLLPCCDIGKRMPRLTLIP